MPNYSNQSYIIVGAGVFGISTAYHITKKYPNAKVVLIDRTPFPCEAGASWDTTKAIRADYANTFWCKIATQAVDIWRNDPLFKPYFRQVGMVWLDDTGHAHRVIDAYKELGIANNAKMATPKELIAMWPGLFDQSPYGGVTEILVNMMSGCAEAAPAVKAVYEYIISKGVQYKVASVAKVLFNSDGDTIGVSTMENEKIFASTTILCTSSYTSKLLADSAPNWVELQPGRRIGALGFVTGQIALTPAQYEQFKSAPVFQQGAGTLQGSR
ncbi:hypothetical protein ABW19_dt0201592 [Dactylella cylindrospora]|nr:hypothetical protein ABW19_dt0201592 [Dactylella cylindrospora]